MRVHVANNPTRPTIYHVTPAAWHAACARHPDLARKLEVTFGNDAGRDLLDAEFLIGVPQDRASLRERAPKLRWIHATHAGLDGLLPFDWLPSGVVLTNNRGAHGVKAEQYLRMAYTLLHTRMMQIIANQHAHVWQQLFSPSIIGRKVVVIGLGDLGCASARAAKQLGLKVIGVRRHAKPCPDADEVHTYDELDAVLPDADFVVLAVPLTSETRGLLDRQRLDLLKPSANVINIARAAVADHEALAQKLRRGELAGAMLDVMEPEPLPADSPLWDTPSLVITPHISCDDSEHYADITLDLWFANLACYVAGKPLQSGVDVRLGY